jgi:hypothetical protein
MIPDADFDHLAVLGAGIFAVGGILVFVLALWGG